MTIKAMVLSVSRPVVAHGQDDWQVKVVYPIKYKGSDGHTYVVKRKKEVFTKYAPKIGEWLWVRLN